MRRRYSPRPIQSRILSAVWRVGSRLLPGGLDSLLAPHPCRIRVTTPAVEVPGLPAAWQGARLALLSDFHVGRFIRAAYVRKVVDVTNDLRPDAVALLGDYLVVDGALKGEVLECFRRLRSPMGSFAVLGNHDHWHGAAEVQGALEQAGVTVLRNAHRLLSREGQEICLAGLDDPWEASADVGSALAGVPPEMPRILLCHNPDCAETLPAEPRVDLMLCGHTHGGQVRLPVLSRLFSPVRNWKYLQGLVQGPRCPVYVTRGVGVVGLPVRFRCPPELAILTLRVRCHPSPPCGAACFRR